MNELDVVILIVLGAFAIFGIFRGMVRLVLGFASFALGILLAAWFSEPFARTFEGLIASATARRLLAAGVLFLGSVIACAVLAWLIRRALKPADLLWADRVAGAVTGAVLAVLIVASAMVPLTAMLPEDSRLVRDSKLAPHVLAISSFLKRLVPEDLRKRYDAARERLKKSGEEALPEGMELPEAESIRKGMETIQKAREAGEDTGSGGD